MFKFHILTKNKPKYVLCIFRCSSENINVQDLSPMVANMLNGVASDLRFEMNGNIYLSYYLLVDGIYFLWFFFV